MERTKVLLLVEGEKVEKDLFNHFYNLYNIDNVEIVAYKTNIYAFYNRLKKDFPNGDGKIDFDYIDIPLFLNDYFNLQGDQLLNEYDFRDIILIFDYDPQDPSYSSDILIELITNFSNSTELGKLYLNYPMVESFKDISSLEEDEKFELLTVPFETVKNKIGKVSEYKKMVDNKTCITNISDINVEMGNKLLNLHASKLKLIIGEGVEEEKKYRNLCVLQCYKFDAEKLIWVINTSILHMLDEYGLISPK
ncbi:hypothetical protein FZC84_20595 [Rossellomorea vietnamensis]|uniref:Uncharacterized protein n=1 Tax=Rossellomorea vietnamensis TaxID=218284 RepID=A0A5D4M318_9BACI|nr:hypothetical protein [Rossellomorea vietnamensis]TYR96279.1 hypothetical protein FZC84_20595 [Rossellomorea vietnamensis]